MDRLYIITGPVCIPKVCQLPHKRGELHYKKPIRLEKISAFDM